MQWAVMQRDEHAIIEGDESSDLPEPKPAATLIVFDEQAGGAAPRLLMVERSQAMKFAGGAAVWPGGRVDPDDRQLGLAAAPSLEQEDAAGRVAAIRETLEETGLLVGAGAAARDAALVTALRAGLAEGMPFSALLAAHGISLDLGVLTPFARWIPKMNSHRRFDTRFYLARLPDGARALGVDAAENSAMFWASAEEALALAESGRIAVIFPTRRNLERLAQYPDYAAAIACARRHPPRIISPWIEKRGESRFLVIPDDAGYPVTAERLENVMRG